MQEKNAQSVRNAQLAGFGERLRDAFDGAKNVEIARKLEVSEAAVRNYLNGRIPDAEMLSLISERTNRSIHWLLTGEEPEYVNSSEKSGHDWIKHAAETSAKRAIEFNRKIAAEAAEKRKITAQRFAQGKSDPSTIQEDALLIVLEHPLGLSIEAAAQAAGRSRVEHVESLIKEAERKGDRQSIPSLTVLKRAYEVLEISQAPTNTITPPEEDRTSLQNAANPNSATLLVDLQPFIADKVKELAIQDDKTYEDEAADLIIEALFLRGEITSQDLGKKNNLFGIMLRQMVQREVDIALDKMAIALPPNAELTQLPGRLNRNQETSARPADRIDALEFLPAKDEGVVEATEENEVLSGNSTTMEQIQSLLDSLPDDVGLLFHGWEKLSDDEKLEQLKQIKEIVEKATSGKSKGSKRSNR